MQTVRNVLFFLPIFFVISDCFIDVDINNDIHDNTVKVGDACDIVRERFGKTGSASSALPCETCDLEPEVNTQSSSTTTDASNLDNDAGSSTLLDVGETCSEDSECQSNFCICQICIDPTQLL